MTALLYIGPGAGFTVIGSFLAILAATAVGAAILLGHPFRWIVRLVTRRRIVRGPFRRVIVIGLDGLDPRVTEHLMQQGRLPHLAQLRQRGGYSRLSTSSPPLSPVAWSSFATGANPGKHNIFDFVRRAPATYTPAMSSVITQPARRALRLGPIRVPLERASIQSLRRSKPFWEVLSDHGIFSAVIRVPLTYPPAPFRGVLLSAMCTPDLLGTQGTSFHFTESGDKVDFPDSEQAVQRCPVDRCGERVRMQLPGPRNPGRVGNRTHAIPVTATRDTLHIQGKKIPLEPGRMTDWVTVTFHLAPGIRVRGLCRFLLRRFDSPFEMYCSPLHLDPARPAMPISHPPAYAAYLVRTMGPFATLGLAEDTTALTAGLITADEFRQSADDIHREREAMLFDAMHRIHRGTITCVFDAPDRIQHMFHRNGAETIDAMYERMDQTVGRVLEQAGDGDAVLVMSDHGFTAFDRCVDLNHWLCEHGYLVLRNGAPGAGGSLSDVDWSRTRAYALGLAGVWINRRGREPQGIVDDAGELIAELAQRLTGLVDPANGRVAVREAMLSSQIYHGPYVEDAPDLIVGYESGYRVSWTTAIGGYARDVFFDNDRPWSGDHCVHRDVVPGVLFSSVKTDMSSPRIVDVAPTVLAMMGVPVPHYMDGQSLLCDGVPSII